jgi:hypothetical protein
MAISRCRKASVGGSALLLAAPTVCQNLARDVFLLRSFSAANRSFPADDLQRSDDAPSRTLKISGGQGSSERSGQLCTRPLHLDVGRLSKHWNSLQRNANTDVIEIRKEQEPSA